MHIYYAYILASKRNGTIYIGVTSHLERRLFEHASGETESFTKKYGVTKLVYYEETNVIGDAIAREKQLKNWRREWKVTLIEKGNPNWEDLATVLLDPESSSG